MTVLGLAGSLRRDSYNLALLRAAARKLPPAEELVLWDELAAVPPFDEDAERHGAPASVQRLRAAIAAADAVLIATPEYNGSVPGQLKNALDWASRPLETTPLARKRVAVVGASTGLFGAVWAQADLRRVLGVIGADVVDLELPVGSAHEAFAADGTLRDPVLDAMLGEVTAALATGTPAAACGSVAG